MRISLTDAAPRLAAFAVLMLLAGPTLAYIGPGAGISVVGSLLNTLLVVLLAILAILFWPIRMLWRKIRGRSGQADKDDPTPPARR
jgi:hypothetical protein